MLPAARFGASLFAFLCRLNQFDVHLLATFVNLCFVCVFVSEYVFFVLAEKFLFPHFLSV